MSRYRIVIVGLTLAALLSPSAALGKGADKATVTGDGLSAPIVFDPSGPGGGEPGDWGKLSRLADATGFFPSLFATYPNPMLDARPESDLGPSVTVRWHMPDGAGGVVVAQDLYPYAEGGPVAYTAPGQETFDPMSESVGGWFPATDDLLPILHSKGFPARDVLAERVAVSNEAAAEDAGVTSHAASRDWWPVGLWAGLGLLVVGGLTMLRRRPRTVLR
ncbi:MAG: hypothetical protein QOH90_107 [Actinomycetota bacterium]|nr:hypothetical protein [Actinomycetota bacterium]